MRRLLRVQNAYVAPSEATQARALCRDTLSRRRRSSRILLRSAVSVNTERTSGRAECAKYSALGGQVCSEGTDPGWSSKYVQTYATRWAVVGLCNLALERHGEWTVEGSAMRRDLVLGPSFCDWTRRGVRRVGTQLKRTKTRRPVPLGGTKRNLVQKTTINGSLPCASHPEEPVVTAVSINNGLLLGGLTYDGADLAAAATSLAYRLHA